MKKENNKERGCTGWGFGELTGLPREKKKKRVIKAEFGRNFTMC